MAPDLESKLQHESRWTSARLRTCISEAETGAFFSMVQMFNDIGAKDNRFGMLVSDPTTGRPCKYGTVLEARER